MFFNICIEKRCQAITNLVGATKSFAECHQKVSGTPPNSAPYRNILQR